MLVATHAHVTRAYACGCLTLSSLIHMRVAHAAMLNAHHTRTYVLALVQAKHGILASPVPPRRGGGEVGGVEAGKVPASKEGGEAAEQDMLESARGRVSLAPSPGRPGRGGSQSPARLLESLAPSPLLRPVLTAMGLAQPLERYSALFACRCPLYVNV
jgi:hypothetical protein